MHTYYRNPAQHLGITLLLLLLAATNIRAQGPKGTTSLSYETPFTKNGLRYTQADFAWNLVGGFGEMELSYDLTTHPDYTKYNYKGEPYYSHGESESMFRQVKASSFKVRARVEGPGFSEEMILSGTAGAGGGWFGNSRLLMSAKTKEQKVVGNWSITPLEIIDINWEGAGPLQQHIERNNAELKRRLAYDQAYEAGMAAAARQDWPGAIRSYEKAKSIGGRDLTNLTQQMARAQEEIRKKGVKESYDELLKAAEEIEQRGDTKAAQKIYEQAAATGHDDPAASRAVQRLVRQIEADQQRRNEEAATLKAKAEEKAREHAATQQKEAQEVKEKMEALRKAQEAATTARHDSLKSAMDAEQRRKWDEARAKQLQEQQAQEEADEKRREDELKEQASKRRARDEEELARFEQDMAFDPERYAEAIAEAETAHEAALAIKPFEALELKREWWDNNAYIQVIADELYEDQRQNNEQEYARRIYAEHSALYNAKNLYMAAIPFTDRGSGLHDYLLQRIKWCNEDLDLNEAMRKNIYRDTNTRRNMRGQAKMMVEAQRRYINSQRADAAFLIYDLHPTDGQTPAGNYLDKMAFEEKLNKADEQYKRDAIITGATQSVALNLMADDSKTADEAGKRTMIWNVYTGIGYESLPILMNHTRKSSVGETKTGTLDIMPGAAEFNVLYRHSRHIDLAGHLRGAYGVYPSEGTAASAVIWGGKGRLDVGVKRFKLANTVEYISRAGTLTEDHDVIQSTLNASATPDDHMANGEFNYSLLRVGTGFKLDLSDGEDLYVLLQAFAEKPSFYPEDLLKNPIYSYRLEVQGYSGFNITVGYAQKYAIAGTARFPLSDRSNQNYMSFMLGKTWTIFDSSHPLDYFN
ncbi:hypothetical protein LJY25_17650 [Hymenobacter sp. BT175]|uniref:hypothetical protein n=1 Tax=Hymenobacter translucens TaxID=2886507 RepID=UPI001D0F3DF3|nr:hypothetical protein [Hymenobacter translucens]MCC2548279.1 hypothetical protein [Hymenobacter translucens]